MKIECRDVDAYAGLSIDRVTFESKGGVGSFELEAAPAVLERFRGDLGHVQPDTKGGHDDALAELLYPLVDCLAEKDDRLKSGTADLGEHVRATVDAQDSARLRLGLKADCPSFPLAALVQLLWVPNDNGPLCPPPIEFQVGRNAN